jgi:peptidoglycan-associated lipoprotein
MKYLTIFFAFVILTSYGCAPKAVQLTPTEQKQVQALQRGDDILKDRDKKTGITEEELAQRDKAREWSLEEIKKNAPFKDIYFEFDSYIIKSDYLPKLNEIGNWLKKYKNIKIAVEGHCDEKGPPEKRYIKQGDEWQKVKFCRKEMIFFVCSNLTSNIQNPKYFLMIFS